MAAVNPDLNQMAEQIQEMVGGAPVALVAGGTPPDQDGPDATIVGWTGGMHRELFELLETAKLNRAITHLTEEQDREPPAKRISFDVTVEVDEMQE